MTINETVLSEERLLEVSDLEKYFPIKQGFLKKEVGQIRAVDGVNFHINDGETLGLVGGKWLWENNYCALYLESR